MADVYITLGANPFLPFVEKDRTDKDELLGDQIPRKILVNNNNNKEDF